MAGPGCLATSKFETELPREHAAISEIGDLTTLAKPWPPFLLSFFLSLHTRQRTSCKCTNLCGGRGQNVWLSGRPKGKTVRAGMFFSNRFWARKSCPRKSSSISVVLYPLPCFEMDHAHVLRNRRLTSSTDGHDSDMRHGSGTGFFNSFSQHLWCSNSSSVPMV